MVEKLADIATVQWNVKITACIRKLQHLCIFHLPPILSNGLPRLSGDFTQTVLFCLYPLKSAHLHLVQSDRPRRLPRPSICPERREIADKLAQNTDHKDCHKRQKQPQHIFFLYSIDKMPVKLHLYFSLIFPV